MKKLCGLTLAMLLGLFVATALAADASGKIQSIDVVERMFVLEDGTKLWLAEGMALDKVKEGAQVKASYEWRDGKNVVTQIDVSE